MFKKSKVIKIADSEITVYELSVKQIRALFSKEFKENTLAEFTARAREFCDAAVHGLAFEDIETLAPSQIKAVYDAFMEVNSDFFETARRLGISDTAAQVVGRIKDAVLADWTSSFAARFAAATQQQWNTGSDSF